MMMVCAVRVVRTSGRGCDSWITFQMREERIVEMCVLVQSYPERNIFGD